MKEALLVGFGLGDYFIKSFNTDSHCRLIQGDHTLLIISHNEKLNQIFADHPNRKFLHIIDAHKWATRLQRARWDGKKIKDYIFDSLNLKEAKLLHAPHTPKFHCNNPISPLRPYAVVHPTAYGQIKRWTPAYAQNLIHDIRYRYEHVFVIGTTERYEGHNVVPLSTGVYTIPQIIDIVQNASHLYGTESCWANLSARSGVPTTIHLPTSFYDEQIQKPYIQWHKELTTKFITYEL